MRDNKHFKNNKGLQFIRTITGDRYTFKKIRVFIENNENRANAIRECSEALWHLPEKSPKAACKLKKIFFRKYGGEIKKLVAEDLSVLQDLESKSSLTEVKDKVDEKGSLSNSDCKQTKIIARMYCKGYLSYMSKLKITKTVICLILPGFAEKTLYNKFLTEVDLRKSKKGDKS